MNGMAQVFGVGAMTALLGVLLSQVFGISRMVFAMARKRDLPRGLEHIHPAHAVPDRAVLLAGAFIVVVALEGTQGTSLAHFATMPRLSRVQAATKRS